MKMLIGKKLEMEKIDRLVIAESDPPQTET